MSFTKDFLWGAASAAYQVEGAYNKDGKGMGIWDALSEGKVKHGENGNVACNHYYKYKEDVALMKQIGLKSYRFSVSWPRIFPDASGKVNKKGLQFYINLVNELCDAGIKPMCTIFHWNLPMWIYEQGGWKCNKISEYFAEYTKVIVEALSDKVDYWITMNEMPMFVGQGYITGIHAPFETDISSIIPVTRNVLFSHAKSVKIIREYAKLLPKIGLAHASMVYIPKSNDAAAIELARADTNSARAAVFSNSWWLDPIVLGTFPNDDLAAMGIDKFLSDDELKDIHQPLDFIGLNIYQSADYNERGSETNPNVYPGMPRTSGGWPITAQALYWLPKFIYEKYKLPMIITESGMPNIDFVMLDGAVHDPQRIDFIHKYLLELKKAIGEGIPVIGYQYWSIMDNFEWAEGYDIRFGLVYVDYNTQQRILKDSALFYAEVIKTNGEILTKA